MSDDGLLHIHECAWILRNDTGDRCGFIQRGPGLCPYDHGEPVALVPLTAAALCSACGIPVQADDCRSDDGRLICPCCVLDDLSTG